MTSPLPLRNNSAVAALALSALLLGGCGAAAVRPAAAPPQAAEAAAPAPQPQLPPKAQSDYLMALNAYKAGNAKIAETLLLALNKEHPELPGPIANLGMIEMGKGELEKAEKLFLKALELKPDLPEVHNQLGILYRNRGEFGKALTSYQAGLALSPDNPNLLLNLGILHDLYLNRPQEALALWQRYKTVVNDDKQVDTWIADIKQRSAAQ